MLEIFQRKSPRKTPTKKKTLLKMVVLSVCLNIFENKKEGKYFRKKKSRATAHKIPKNHPPAKKNTPKNTQVLKKNKKYSKKLLKYFRKIKNTTKKNSYPGSSSKKKRSGCTSHTEGPGSTGPGVFQWIWPILRIIFFRFQSVKLDLTLDIHP